MRMPVPIALQPSELVKKWDWLRTPLQERWDIQEMARRLSHFFHQLSALVAAALLASIISGCGGDKGPRRHELSGTVTYKNQPVPAGEISFIPDSSQGNSGPGGVARIIDGHYRTEPGKGIVGGPHHVRIYGYDGVAFSESADGKPLFRSVRMKVNFSEESTRHDFVLPP